MIGYQLVCAHVGILLTYLYRSITGRRVSCWCHTGHVIRSVGCCGYSVVRKPQTLSPSANPDCRRASRCCHTGRVSAMQSDLSWDVGTRRFRHLALRSFYGHVVFTKTARRCPAQTRPVTVYKLVCEGSVGARGSPSDRRLCRSLAAVCGSADIDLTGR